MKSKNIEKYYNKGYITQEELWCCLRLIYIYNHAGIPNNGNFDGTRVDKFRNFNENILTYQVKNLLDYQWIIETLKTEIAKVKEIKPKFLYVFLDFLFNDLSMKNLKNKYKADHTKIKEIVIVFSKCLVVLMRERKILKS